MRNLLAFDLGASNGRAILGQFDGEKITMRELHRFENNYIEMNGVFYWDLPYLYSQLKHGLLAFKNANVGELDCIGIDTWGVDYGLLDKNGHLLSNPRSYRYAVDADMEAVWKTVDFPTLFARTGIASMNFNTVYQLYRRKQQDDPALAAAETLLFMPDLLGYFLTGEKKSEYTEATTSMLYNPTTKDWDWQTIESLGLPKKIFTPLDRAGSLRGTLRPELAEKIDAQAYVQDAYERTIRAAEKLPEDSPLESRMREMMKLNLDWFMQTLLDRKDRMSMYNSLEVRVPFCDYRIAEYLYNVPWEYKDWNGYEKGLLRTAMQDVLPPEVLWRKKSPYPKTHNPSYLRAVSEMLQKVLDAPDAPVLQIVRREMLEQLLDSEESVQWYGQLMTRPQIMAYFVQMDYWMRKYQVKVVF